MQSLAFATNTVGISLEKIGDISKDTQEKVGEFLATGGGGFKDFVDVLGLTNAEAIKVAESFKDLSGPDILQEVVNQLEAAGKSGKEISFALEGLASDTTDLIPLLTNGGEKLKDLTGGFDDLNFALSQSDVDKIKRVGVEFDKLTSSFSAESKQLVADYSTELIKAFGIISAISETSSDLIRGITLATTTPFAIAQAALTDFVNGTNTLDAVIQDRRDQVGAVIDDLFETEGLADKAFEYSENLKLSLNEALGVALFEVGKDGGNSLADGIAAGIEENDKPLEITIKKGKQLTDWEKLNSKERLSAIQGFTRAASILSNEFLEDNKAVNAGLVVADTAAGIMKAISTSSNIYEGFANAAIVAATGIVQLNTVLGAQKGGGTISSGTTGVAATSQVRQQTTEEETSTLDLTEQSESGVSVQRIILSTDDGEDLLDALAKRMTENERQGR